jgi:hypothetical protein
MSTYLIKEIQNNRFQIANFEDSAAPEGVYELLYTKTRDYMSCNCRGFRMQKDKSEHKHCKMARFWMSQGKPEGVALWEYDGEYKMNRFVEV